MYFIASSSRRLEGNSLNGSVCIPSSTSSSSTYWYALFPSQIFSWILCLTESNALEYISGLPSVVVCYRFNSSVACGAKSCSSVSAGSVSFHQCSSHEMCWSRHDRCLPCTSSFVSVAYLLCFDHQYQRSVHGFQLHGQLGFSLFVAQLVCMVDMTPQLTAVARDINLALQCFSRHQR